MTNGTDAARQAEVDVIMAGGQEKVNRYLITGMMDLQKNGCARGCGDSRKIIVFASGAGAFIAGLFEGVRTLIK